MRCKPTFNLSAYLRSFLLIEEEGYSYQGMQTPDFALVSQSPEDACGKKGAHLTKFLWRLILSAEPMLCLASRFSLSYFRMLKASLFLAATLQIMCRPGCRCTELKADRQHTMTQAHTGLQERQIFVSSILRGQFEWSCLGAWQKLFAGSFLQEACAEINLQSCPLCLMFRLCKAQVFMLSLLLVIVAIHASFRKSSAAE